eukprot:maker-scaffold_5-snap-gene-0.6-mRNA-1 protein AED:0.02 eAED:0.02 QI:90/1/1/1/1/1/4/99/410
MDYTKYKPNMNTPLILLLFFTFLSLSTSYIIPKDFDESFALTTADSRVLKEKEEKPEGRYRNYVVTWTVDQYEQNLVNVSLYIHLELTRGSLSSLQTNVFDNRFGSIVPNSVTVFRDFTDEELTLQSESDAVEVDDTTYIVKCNIGEELSAGDDVALIYKFQVEGAFCRDGNNIGLSGTWVGFETISIDHIEFQAEVAKDLVNADDLDFRFKPSTKGARYFDDVDNFFVQSLPFTSGDLGYPSDFPQSVFIAWSPSGFSDDLISSVQECPTFPNYLLFYVLIVGAIILFCCCLTVVAFVYKYTYLDPRESRRRRRERGRVRRHNRVPDIVLLPEDDNSLQRDSDDEEEDQIIVRHVPDTNREPNLIRAVSEQDDADEDFLDQYTRSFRIRLSSSGEGRVESEYGNDDYHR